MDHRTKTILAGLTAGLVQGNLLLVFAALIASRAVETGDLIPAWEAATISGISISFGMGLILDDAYDAGKALLLSLVVALAFSMPLVNLLSISITASPEQGYAEAAFFGILVPGVLFAGLLAAIIGTMIREFSPVRPSNPLTRRTRNVLILLSIIFASFFGFYVFSVVDAPNFSVVTPVAASVRSDYVAYNQTWGSIAIPFNVTLNPLRGYIGTVSVIDPSVPYYGLCSPASLHLPLRTTTSCQFGANFPPGVYTFRFRATDQRIIHDFNLQVNVS